MREWSWRQSSEKKAYCAESGRVPNIVLILADDLGFADLGCYGHPYARTPNLDRLASEGTRFEQFYSTGVTCCPARTGFMTGRFPATFATYPAGGGFGNCPTVTDWLKKVGYHTGHFGKWHIGPDESPGKYSIDEVNARDESRRRQQRNPRGRDAPIFDNAIRFIEKHRDGPFYVNVWGHVSHHPITPPVSYVDKFGDVVVKEMDFAPPMQEKFSNCRAMNGDVSQHMRRYLADVYSMDEDVGRLLQRIDELGLRDNTIVVFSSDQGPAPLRLESDSGAGQDNKKKDSSEKAELRLSAMGYVGDLRGGKHTMYEGGVRVPLIVRWPGHVSAGRVDKDSVASGIDWLPTICRLADAMFDSSQLAGEDMSAAWLGKGFRRSRPLLWKISNPRSQLAMREGPWKLHDPNRQRGEIELFDIATDPGERENLAAKHPEIVKAMQARLQAWNATLPKEYVKTDDKQD